ncbi:hypothetical protein, partial [Achromobacter insuavis]|uniref:hypothetical protein n=1 Tax=Achromobacter insuavis TaxID=1287735 RepID=UPI001F133A87
LALAYLQVMRVRCARVTGGFLLAPHVGRWGGGGRRGAKRIASDEPLAPPTNSRGADKLSIANDSAVSTRASGITARKTPRKPQKAARAAGLRRAPSHHSSHARSGNLNRKILRMPPMAACAAEEGRSTQDLPLQNHTA